MVGFQSTVPSYSIRLRHYRFIDPPLFSCQTEHSSDTVTHCNPLASSKLNCKENIFVENFHIWLRYLGKFAKQRPCWFEEVRGDLSLLTAVLTGDRRNRSRNAELLVKVHVRQETLFELYWNIEFLQNVNNEIRCYSYSVANRK